MGPPKAQNITQTNTVELSPEQQQVFDAAWPSIQSYASSLPSLFPGTGIVGFNPLETAGQSAALAAAGTGAQLASGAASAQQQLLDPNFMLNPNQYVQAAADASANITNRNLMENILPGIRSGATAAGGMYSGGSTREGIATGLAAGRTGEAISNTTSDLFFRNYLAGLGGLQNAIQANPGVMSQQLFPASVYSAVGGQQRGMEQAQLDETIRNFYANQDMDLSHAQQLINLLAGMPGGTGTTTVTGAQPQSNPALQWLGLGMSMLGGPLGGLMGAGLGGLGGGMMKMPMGK